MDTKSQKEAEFGNLPNTEEEEEEEESKVKQDDETDIDRQEDMTAVEQELKRMEAESQPEGDEDNEKQPLREEDENFKDKTIEERSEACKKWV